MNDRPTVEELKHMYASLTRDERNDLLEKLLVAAAHGGEAMAVVVDVWLLDRALGRTDQRLCSHSGLRRIWHGRRVAPWSLAGRSCAEVAGFDIQGSPTAGGSYCNRVYAKATSLRAPLPLPSVHGRVYWQERFSMAPRCEVRSARQGQPRERGRGETPV